MDVKNVKFIALDMQYQANGKGTECNLWETLLTKIHAFIGWDVGNSLWLQHPSE